MKASLIFSEARSKCEFSYALLKCVQNVNLATLSSSAFKMKASFIFSRARSKWKFNIAFKTLFILVPLFLKAVFKEKSPFI